MASRTDIIDPLQDRVAAAMRLAETVGGGDDARVLQTFHSVLNAVDTVEARADAAASGTRPAPQRTAAASTALRRGIARRTAVGGPAVRPAVPPAAGVEGIPEDSVFSDPTFLANARWVIANRRRIVGGIGGVAVLGFPDCVAVGARNQWCCTGTLIAPNLVVTAAHCEGECDSRAFIGVDVDKPDDGRIVKVRDRAVHPSYETREPHGDVALLILDEAIDDVAPRRIAPATALDRQQSVRVVGYGHTDVDGSTGYGERRLVDVPLATNDPRFGGDPATEFVAGAPFLDRDSCSGDSGGPAYVSRRGRWLLVGATSRATASSLRTCGDGGVYTFLPAYDDWLAPFLSASRRKPQRRPSRRPRMPS
jgi:hypothetical protein